MIIVFIMIKYKNNLLYYQTIYTKIRNIRIIRQYKNIFYLQDPPAGVY
ncbi:hypothetical protein BACPEC_01988 [[Bacteroides] pectinophilus ATCC 43243]|uniref:Uncharacterized protein n=1 Tax=[Bacteroides] pectinophilus ATCC 43243 TaxID=483218 RepID=B7ASD3_9FIRM|nr:hypothetical protein BACPEC_01988 [[Bacteroides] pectinophilus ATCC 43243]